MRELSGSDFPQWLVATSWLSLLAAFGCAAALVVDLSRRPQPMRVMNTVWPICALFGSILWVGAYTAWGRAPLRDGIGRPDRPVHGPGSSAHTHHDEHEGRLGCSPRPRTMSSSVFVGTSHCGAGCTVADVAVEWMLFFAPAAAVAGGLHWLFDEELYAGWVIAYGVALVVGICFQYLAIAPMNQDRPIGRNLRAAARADVLALTAWQVGMYGTMALAQLWVFPTWLNGTASVATPVFWAVMQLAMLVGFCTSFPVNWWLIRAGVKERM